MPTIDFSRYYEFLNKAYHPLVTDTSRFQILKGGSGSGKSHFIAQDEIYKQIFFPGTNLLIVRNTSHSNGTSTFPLMKQIIREFKVEHLFHITYLVIRCKHNGNEIRFCGLDDVEKIKSITFTSGVLSRIWVEEATETKETDINQLNLRLRGITKVPFQMRLSFNPVSAMHWIKSRFFDKLDERNQIKILHTNYKDNRFLDNEYKRQLQDLENIDKVFYQVYCLGEWGVFGNIIFTNWSEEICPYSEKDFDEVFTGMDFGFNHPLAVEKVGLKDGNLWSFDELYIREKTNKEVIVFNEEIKIITSQKKCTADSAEPARIKEWQQHGYRVEPAIKGKDSVRRGIDYLKTLKWYIDPTKCPGLLSEVQSYSWKEDRFGEKTEEPVNFKDDAIAAVRYALEERSMSTRGLFFA